MSQADVERDLATIRDGLPPRDGKRHRVIVVGAGMAGLVAASELDTRLIMRSLRNTERVLTNDAVERLVMHAMTLRHYFVPNSLRQSRTSVQRDRMVRQPM